MTGLPQSQDMHYDEVLSNMSAAYIQSEDNYVAHQVFPELAVTQETGKYVSFPKGYFFRTEAGRVLEGAETRSKDFEAAFLTYEVEHWGLHKDISDRKRANISAPIDVDKTYTAVITQDLLIRREVQFATKFLTSTAPWTYTRTGTTHFVKWNAGGSTPIANADLWLDDLGELTGNRPNVGVFGPRVWTVLKNHAETLARVTGGATNGSPASVSQQMIAALLGLDEVYVARASRNIAPQATPGTDAVSMQYIVDDVALFAYRTKTPNLELPSAGYMVVQSEFDKVKPGAAAMKQYRMEHIGGGSDRYEGFSAFAPIASAADMAVLILDIL